MLYGVISVLLSLLMINNFCVLIGGLVLCFLGGMIMMSKHFYYVDSGIFYYDSISNLMVLLTLGLALLIFLANPRNKEVSYKMSLISLTLILVICFKLNNLLFFYFFFELSLIPTLFLILSWGYQPERLQAGLYMMMYTVGASLPLLMIIISLKLKEGTSNLWLLEKSPVTMSGYLFLMFILAFLVKLPLYGVHLWLPKAHVEAPLAGSMILAGVLLKLGGYGLYLSCKIIEVNYLSVWYSFLLVTSLFGGLMSAIICMCQNDLKAFVAYSSITHMSFVVVAFLVNSTWGVVSGGITMFAHGFTSSAMFLLAFLMYKMASSRSLSFMGGYLKMFPFLSLSWFIFCSVNMAVPPSLNLVGELAFIGCIQLWGWVLVSLSLIIMWWSVLYNMFLYSLMNHGAGSNYTIAVREKISSAELLSLSLHLLFLVLIFKMEFFILWTEICFL